MFHNFFVIVSLWTFQPTVEREGLLLNLLKTIWYCFKGNQNPHIKFTSISKVFIMQFEQNPKNKEVTALEI